MKRIVIAALAAAAWCTNVPATAQAPALVNAQNPETVRALFAAWGHDPTPLRIVDGQPLFEASDEDFHFFVAFNGCTDGRGCNYVVFIVNYDDVANPPYEWLNRQNYRYDMVTASRRADDGRLSLRTGITLGPDGIPESTLALAFGDWIDDTNRIARDAFEAGLVNEDEADAAEPPSPQ
jgi:hypothetical protein